MCLPWQTSYTQCRRVSATVRVREYVRDAIRGAAASPGWTTTIAASAAVATSQKSRRCCSRIEFSVWRKCVRAGLCQCRVPIIMPAAPTTAAAVAAAGGGTSSSSSTAAASSSSHYHHPPATTVRVTALQLWLLIPLLLSFVVPLITSPAQANPEAKRLYEDLLSTYNRLIRPVGNNSDRLTVKLGLKLSQLIDVVSH